MRTVSYPITQEIWLYGTIQPPLSAFIFPNLMVLKIFYHLPEYWHLKRGGGGGGETGGEPPGDGGGEPPGGGPSNKVRGFSIPVRRCSIRCSIPVRHCSIPEEKQLITILFKLKKWRTLTHFTFLVYYWIIFWHGQSIRIVQRHLF